MVPFAFHTVLQRFLTRNVGVVGYSAITQLFVMHQSIRNFNIPLPPGIPRHLTVHRTQGGGNLTVALEGWGI